MPAKRKRAADGRDDREDSPGLSQPARKKKTLQYDPQEICQELYNTIRNAKSDEGHLLCEAFIRVPKRRTAADYYDVVTTPIDLLKIQQKLKTEEYDDVDLMTCDVQLMINNAKAYYKKDSQEYRDACELWEIYEEVKAELMEETFGSLSDVYGSDMGHYKKEELGTFSDDSDATDVDDSTNQSSGDAPSIGDKLAEDEAEEKLQRPVTLKENGGLKREAASGSDGIEQAEAEGSDAKSDSRHDLNEELEQLFAAVMTAKDGDRNISEIFQLLPSRSKYQEYYEIIRNPIDLKTIAIRIQENKYHHLDELERDLNLMIRNAQTYNDPKSIIFKDACTLKKFVTARKQELEYKRSGVVKTSERLRSRERSAVQRLSAVCAALRYQSEDDDTASSQMDFDGDSDGEDSDSPFWALYNAIKDYTTPDGESLHQPFRKLPSKKFYPDYYKEIKRPMSLFNVRKKIKANMYQSLRDCAFDLNLIFENARKYNVDESKIYKDACMLQKVLMEKKRELDKVGAPEDAPVVVAPSPSVFPNSDLPAFTPRMMGREIDDLMPTPRTKGRKSDTPEVMKKKTLKKAAEDGGLKRRLNMLFKTVYEYSDANGRLLRTMFMGLPSRKDYPDYYQVIMEPIDLTMIEAKIKLDKYPNEQALLCDFELMFNNARHYNEEGSGVYQDADTLDRILRSKWRIMSSKATPGRRSKSFSSSPLSQKLQDLYETVRDYQDKAGRALSTPFIKLPLKTDYPDYYEVIKKPMDMQRIQQKLLSGQYDNLEDMVADFVQMFDNACKYNEPESVIYKDALTLQRVVFEKKMELMEGTNDVPDVRALVQEIIRNLFITTFNAQDDEGRCYSDAFAELPELLSSARKDGGEPTERMMSFDQIKRNIDRGRYRRLDRFQDDMFRLFEQARKVSRTDSQLYEDAVEMQMLFIKSRDEICKNGELLLTPALSYTERHLLAALEVEKKEKLTQEVKEEEEKKKTESVETDEVAEESKPTKDDSSEKEIVYKDQTYVVGDFVYIEPRELGLEPHIMMIENFKKDESGAVMIRGCYFYRPNETYHLATRKFLEKEVFKTEQSHDISMSQIIGRCCVMSVKDYFKMRPEGIPDKDVYVCESRYSIRCRAFKKIKIWQSLRSVNLTLVPRDIPLVPVRVESVFANKITSENKDLDDGDLTPLDKERMNIVSEGAAEDGNTYYDQLICNGHCLKLGDSVYVRSDRDYPLIARIDKLWTTSLGDAFFHGCWFVRPSEIQHAPTRLFYKREVFLSSIEDTNPLGSIINKCCVLHFKDFCSSRPTEIPEHDVYICESKYHELEHSIKKLGKPFKKHSLSPKVTDDEIYFFRKPVALQKWVEQEPSPLLMKVADDQSSYMETESIRDTEADAASDIMNDSVEVSTPAPEKPTKKRSVSSRRQPSGYIVFAGEIRKSIQNENPESSFGDISRIVGLKWRSLSKGEKEVFEDRAKKLADEMAAKQQEADRAFNDSLQRSQSPWDGSQASPRPATPGNYPPPPPGFSTPYPAGYPQTPGGPHPGYYPGPNPPGTPQTQAGQTIVAQQPARPPSPLFIPVPPRTQKLLHSEAYLKYIEGLGADNRTISNFPKVLAATPDNTPVPSEANLPAHWLAQGVGYHGSVTHALWALRDLMLKDTLSIARTLPFDEL